VEIRRALVEAAEADRQALQLEHLHYLFCNANVSLEQWLQQLPSGRLERVTIQFPDPWFKKETPQTAGAPTGGCCWPSPPPSPRDGNSSCRAMCRR
jgi:hypothetical protein